MSCGGAEVCLQLDRGSAEGRECCTLRNFSPNGGTSGSLSASPRGRAAGSRYGAVAVWSVLALGCQRVGFDFEKGELGWSY